MSYAMTHGRRMQPRRRRSGLGGWLDDLAASAATDLQKQFEATCPPSATTLSWQAKIGNLQATWNPPAIVTADELRGVVGAMMNMANAQHNMVMTTRASYDIPLLADAESAYNDIGKQAVDYTTAVTAAYQQAGGGGTSPVYAPGLKQWVIDAMTTLVKGMRAVEIASCTKPSWLSAAQTFQGAFDATYGAAKAVVGTVIEVGQKAVAAVEAPLSIIGWLGRNPALAVGAGLAVVYIVTKYKRK